MVLVVWVAGSYLYSVAGLNRRDGGSRSICALAWKKKRSRKANLWRQNVGVYTVYWTCREMESDVFQ